MTLIYINKQILTVNGRFGACVNSRAADTFADNRVARTGLALQVPRALSSTAGAADAAHDTRKHTCMATVMALEVGGSHWPWVSPDFLSSLTMLTYWRTDSADT